jgi:hypothetical protein
LGGSAPRLQYLRLNRISFPQLPTFLLSARNLVTLKLKDISQDGYISPETMVGTLAVLTKLATLSVSFLDDTPSESPTQSRSHLDSPMRAILPALTNFHYIGSSEYLEDLLAQIDTPRLTNLVIEYFIDEIQVPQLSRFIDRTKSLKLDQFRSAEVFFFFEDIYFELDCPRGKCCRAHLSLKILGQSYLDEQATCAADVLGQLASTFPNVDHLSADGDRDLSTETDITDWLPFFRLFPAVEAMHLSGGAGAYIASALEDTADPEEMVTDIVFPALYLLWIEKGEEEEDESDESDDDRHKPVGSIERFLSLRQLSGRPVTVVDTQDEFLEADRKPL